VTQGCSETLVPIFLSSALIVCLPTFYNWEWEHSLSLKWVPWTLIICFLSNTRLIKLPSTLYRIFSSLAFLHPTLSTNNNWRLRQFLCLSFLKSSNLSLKPQSLPEVYLILLSHKADPLSIHFLCHVPRLQNILSKNGLNIWVQLSLCLLKDLDPQDFVALAFHHCH
jgi:hypothetical protein